MQSHQFTVLDTFCGGGGASKGYYQAGYRVIGVDINPQPHYPFEFHQGDAIEYIYTHGHEFDLIHASPPCQSYGVNKHQSTRNAPMLIEPVRKALQAVGRPYVIENVPGAPLENPLMLCGSMFGLPLIRHRLFETSPTIWWPPTPHTCGALYTHSGQGQRSSFASGATAICVAGNDFCADDGRIAMGISWLPMKSLTQAIPPAYTKWIGAQMAEYLRTRLPNKGMQPTAEQLAFFDATDAVED